ncbi:hypothetical protein Plhal304r1_c001g0001391 [Plasmopara halstedii]
MDVMNKVQHGVRIACFVETKSNVKGGWRCMLIDFHISKEKSMKPQDNHVQECK